MTLIEERTLVEETAPPTSSPPPATTRDRSVVWLLAVLGAVAAIVLAFFAFRGDDGADASNHQQVLEHGSPTAVDHAAELAPNHPQMIEHGSPTAVDNAVDAGTSNHEQVIDNGSPTAVDNTAEVADQGFYPEAETTEREAHLAGQARTHAGPASTPESDSSESAYLPGSRHVPVS